VDEAVTTRIQGSPTSARERNNQEWLNSLAEGTSRYFVVGFEDRFRAGDDPPGNDFRE